MISGVPLPRWLAKTNKAGLNRVVKHITGCSERTIR
jgi:hypothetical protein